MKGNTEYSRFAGIRKIKKFARYYIIFLKQRKKLSIFLLLLILPVLYILISWATTPTKRKYVHVPLKHEDVHNRNLDRHEHTKKICKINENSDLKKMKEIVKTSKHIKIDTEHKLLYCVIDNPEQISWKQVMTMILMQKHLAKIDKQDFALHFDSIDDFDFNVGGNIDFNIVMTKYHRFMIARNPYERLLSIYKHNLEEATEKNQKFRLKHGVQIIKKYRPDAPNIARRRGITVKFHEFLKYVTTYNFDGSEAIFEPVFDMCHPCLFNYTMIANHETITDDSTYAFKKIGIQDMTFPLVYDPYQTEDMMRQYYSKIPMDIIRVIQQRYEKDFEIFHYDPNHIPGVRFY